MYYSVIVTVYQVELYLEKCVDSILGQTFQDFELILVDDGSPDKCPELCDACAAKDRRVKVIHQKNAGPASAREAGLLSSEGRYIVFVDGDDWIREDYLKRGYELLERTQADTILFACVKDYGEFSQTVYEPAQEGLYEKEDIAEKLYPKILMDSQMGHMFYYISGKIYNRSLVRKFFDTTDKKIFLGEDMLLTVSSYLEAGRVYISREAVNYYRIRKESNSHSFKIEHYRQIIMVLENLKRIACSHMTLPGDFARPMERYGAYMCFTCMIHCVNTGQIKQLREIKRQMNQPLLRSCIRQAGFKEISPKTRITYMLFRRNWIFLSYVFLWICMKLKKGQIVRWSQKRSL